MTKIAILASHNGSGFDTIYENAKELNISIELLISNNSDSLALQKAKERGIECYLINSKTEPDPDQKIYDLINDKNCSMIYLSGYMKKISSDLTSNFKVINSHPSLLPKYGGKGMYGRFVHEAVIKNKDKISGCTLHYVNDVYDDGEIILQNKINLDDQESVESLEKKIKQLEAKTIIEGLKKCLN
ncbi:formyltransferase family protein [Sulfurimonas sp.]|uniref:formyltransferase family protein n=1 Tax=Sulfurimonas sp. TaxID=2022749 RepID=UPI003565AE9B